MQGKRGNVRRIVQQHEKKEQCNNMKRTMQQCEYNSKVARAREKNGVAHKKQQKNVMKSNIKMQGKTTWGEQHQ